jgi:ring-1,2-phenylacetyl-CoA epoxidase subunit PaaE
MVWAVVAAMVVVAILVLRTLRPKQLLPVGAPPVGVRTLKVVGVVRETADAVVLKLEDVAGKPVPFLAGQFLSLKFDVAGEPLFRNYSLCTMPGAPGPVAVAVKRTRGGKVSNHINENVKVGDLIEARGPSGRFVCEPEIGQTRHHVLVAGGSGITPMMAIAQTVLVHEPMGRVTLLYGNRRPEDVIFKAELAALEAAHATRLRVVHVLQEPPADHAGLSGMLDARTFAAALSHAGIDTRDARFYLCGPEPMMNAARQTLLERNVSPDEIFEERFTVAAATVSTAGTQPVTFIGGGKRTLVEVRADQTILEAGLAAKLDLAHSCTIGVCGTCIVKKRAGTVQMNEGHCLSDEEQQKGYVLICCAHPSSPTEIDLDG